MVRENLLKWTSLTPPSQIRRKSAKSTAAKLQKSWAYSLRARNRIALSLHYSTQHLRHPHIVQGCEPCDSASQKHPSLRYKHAVFSQPSSQSHYAKFQLNWGIEVPLLDVPSLRARIILWHMVEKKLRVYSECLCVPLTPCCTFGNASDKVQATVSLHTLVGDERGSFCCSRPACPAVERFVLQGTHISALFDEGRKRDSCKIETMKVWVHHVLWVGPWSECSSPCRPIEVSPIPKKSHTVTKLHEARGASYVQCSKGFIKVSLKQRLATLTCKHLAIITW